MLGWLTLDTIPDRANFCISLPDAEEWRAVFLGCLLGLSKSENWETFGALSVDQMGDEWRAVLFDFINGGCSMIPVATILEYVGSSLPDGFFWCDGSPFVRGDFPNLFAEIGVTFGAGNGTTTANLPDKRGRVGVGVDNSIPDFDSLGNVGGEKDHTLITSETPVHTHVQNAHTHTQNSHSHILPAHNHTQTAHAHILDGGINAAAGAVVRGMLAVGTGSNNTVSQSTTPAIQNASPSIAVETAVNQNATAVNQSAGSGNAHENMPPFLVCNYIIKY